MGESVGANTAQRLKTIRSSCVQSGARGNVLRSFSSSLQVEAKRMGFVSESGEDLLADRGVLDLQFRNVSKEA